MGRDFGYVFVTSGTNFSSRGDPPRTPQSNDDDSHINNQCDWSHSVSRHNDEIPSGRYTSLELAMYIAKLGTIITAIAARKAVDELLGGESMFEYDSKNTNDLVLISKVLDICEKGNLDYGTYQHDDSEIFMLKGVVCGDITEITEAISVSSRALNEIPPGMDIVIRYD